MRRVRVVLDLVFANQVGEFDSECQSELVHNIKEAIKNQSEGAGLSPGSLGGHTVHEMTHILSLEEL